MTPACPPLTLILIPNGVITDQVQVEIRCGLYNNTGLDQKGQLQIYIALKETLPAQNPLSRRLVGTFSFEIASGDPKMISTRWNPRDLLLIKPTEIIINAIATMELNISEAKQGLTVIPSHTRSTGLIGGAWAGIYHWSEKEGRLWNPTLKRFQDADWRVLVKGIAQLGMQTIVIQEVFRNQEYYHKHEILKKGYKGKAFYRSSLFPDRMKLGNDDPIDAILIEADAAGIHVFLGVGLYAWFDFSYESLDWHKKVMTELWQLYGHHHSLYGWYISEEIHGAIKPEHLNIKAKDDDEQIIATYRQEIVDFFKELRRHANTLCPEKPIMVAANCHHLTGAEDTWRAVLNSCQIVCPFGFHRMPPNDLTGENAAALLQRICDEAGTHLWLDLEIFLFGKLGQLYPRPIESVIQDLKQFPTFEKVICYQYPGLLNAPDAPLKPGDPRSVDLFRAYEDYFHSIIPK